MSNKNIILIGALVLVIVAASVYMMTRSNNTTSNSSNTNETQNIEDVAEETQEVDEQGTVAGVANCTRSFDETKLANDKVALANQFVELDIQNFGKVKIQLYDKDAPKAVENFLRLTNAGFYDCLTFHRIAKGFVIQGGDPKGNGTGGLSVFGGEFEDELNPETPSYKEGYKRGVLAMANHGANTNSSQFFIMTSDYPLEHKYTIFGKVVEGMEAVDKVSQVEIVPTRPSQPQDGTPKEKVIIEKATIIK